MERLVFQRKPIRSSFTKTFNAIKLELSNIECDVNILNLHLTKLKRLHEELGKLDEQILNLIIADNDEVKYEEEYLMKENYNDNFDHARLEVNNYILKIEKRENVSNISTSPSFKRKLNLPKIELKQFGGELKDWLSFWSQFKRIHNDTDMQAEDKFQYLIQATVSGSKAREIVDSFPPTAENYNKVIDVLTSRFGREELLTEHYVRELLGLVVKNSSTTKGNINVSQLYDRLESHLRALESIGMTSDKYSAMLFPLVESCVPEEILRAWIRSPVSRSLNLETTDSENNYSHRLQQLLVFLRSEVEGEERISMARRGFKGFEKQYLTRELKYRFPEDSKNLPTASNLFTGEKSLSGRPHNNKPLGLSCVFCDKTHESRDCFSAQKMPLNKKKEILCKKKACFSCLKVGHQSKLCKCITKCILCGRTHVTIMCPSLPINELKLKPTADVNEGTTGSTSPKGEEDNSANLTSQSKFNEQQVLLQTLKVQIRSESFKETRTIRALIDSGSQKSYILKKTVSALRYTPIGEKELVHTLFGGVNTKKNVHKCYKIDLSSLEGDYKCKMNVLDQQIICNTLPRLPYGPWIEELKSKNITLTDVGEGQPEIELLIGADTLGNLLTGNTYKLTSGLVAVHTRLGWTVMGKSSSSENSECYGGMATSLFLQSEKLSDIWSLDVLGITDPYQIKSKEEMEMAAQKHFDSTVIVNQQGRFEIKLPWVEFKDCIGLNKNTAEKRLQTTTAKLIKDKKFCDYDEVFNLWEKLGIIEEVMDENSKCEGYYMPHRAVIKEQSTTKVRPVFDASSKSQSFLSLNDCLQKGPNLIDLIPSVLIKFREKQIGVISDIEKAFLQIAVNKNDCEYLKFLWWKNYKDNTLKVYRHCRVVFGVNCSPFVLAAVILYHLKNCPEEFKETADKLKMSFYVDNCVTSLESKEALHQFVNNATILMKSAKFNLRDWKSSLKEEIHDDIEPVGVLGIKWDRTSDELFCEIKNIDVPEVVSRRVILSTMQKIFDPIGFSCPVTICPKLLLQESWKSKSSWDDEVPQDVKEKFLKWNSELHILSCVKLPRYIGINNINDLEHVSLHIFCDASKISYATVIFLRTVLDGNVNVQLIMAKSRISPLKEMTIPRLELMACCIGARLSKTVKKGFSFDLSNLQEFYWTDSSTALFWILKIEPWGTFVINRVKEIREETGQNWYHISGDLNPADLPSRGCSAKSLLESRWWEGPVWLTYLKRESSETSTGAARVSTLKRNS